MIRYTIHVNQGATSEYPATLFTCVGVLWRTRYITIVAILIQWDANKWPAILKFLTSTPAPVQGCLSEIVKKDPLEGTKILFCGPGWNIFHPMRYQFSNIYYLLKYFFSLSGLKGTAKPFTVDLLRLNTLWDTKSTLLTLKRYNKQPCPFHRGAPPHPSPPLKPCPKGTCQLCLYAGYSEKPDNILILGVVHN